MIRQLPVKGKKIQAAKPYHRIYDTGDPGHVAEQPGHQIKSEKADQSPVNCSYDNDGQCKTIQSFIHERLPPFALIVKLPSTIATLSFPLMPSSADFIFNVTFVITKSSLDAIPSL